MSSADTDFRDAALILLAHGSTLSQGSALPAFQHRDALRRLGLFAEVQVAFWKLEPFVGGVLRRVEAPRLFLVPLFIADGWFTTQVFPRELGLRGPEGTAFPRRQQLSDGRWVHYAEAVGTHPSMTGVLVSRAAETLARHPFPHRARPAETTLVLVGHGTGYSRGSREALDRQAERIRKLGLYAEVLAVFLEESPRVSDCLDLATTRNLVVVPFFISDGLHTQEDIPVMLGESAELVRRRLSQGQPSWSNPTERRGRRIWCAPAIGSEPGLTQVILERVRELARGLGAEPGHVQPSPEG